MHLLRSASPPKWPPTYESISIIWTTPQVLRLARYYLAGPQVRDFGDSRWGESAEKNS